MAHDSSRRSFLKLAGVVSAVGLAVDLADPPKAEAALVATQAVIDFRKGDDSVIIRADLDGITPTTNPADLQIEIIVSNLQTGEILSWRGPPTAIR